MTTFSRPIPTFLLLSCCFSLWGCNSSDKLHKTEWKQSSGLAKPVELQSLSFSNSKILRSNNEQIRRSVQTISGIEIEHTYLKTIANQTGNDKQIRAQHLSELTSLNKVHQKKADEFIATTGSAQKEILKKYPYFSRQRHLTFKPLALVNPRTLDFIWTLSYTDKLGQPWQARISDKLDLISLTRVGSQFHDTLAILYPAGPLKSSLETVKLRNLNVEPTLSTERLHVSSQAENRITEIQNIFSFTPQDARFDQAQVFYFLQESLLWFENKLNFILPYQLQAEVHIGFPEKTNAAFYYDGKIRLGAGDDETYKRIPQDPTIVVHESVHALVDALSGLPFDGEGGSINEGIADFITALQLNNPNMGEASYLKGPYRRTVNNALTLQQKNGGIYHDSGIISGLLWELSEKLGKDKTRNLTLYTLNRLTPMSDFSDFNSALKDATMEYFKSLEEQKIIQQVLNSRGFKW